LNLSFRSLLTITPSHLVVDVAAKRNVTMDGKAGSPVSV